MEFSLPEVFGIEPIVRNLSYFLLVVAMGMPNLFLLRVVAIASGIAGLALAIFVSHDGTAAFWQSFFILMNVWQLVVSRSRKFGRALSEEEQLFRNKVVPQLSPGQTRKLLSAGRWRDAERGEALTRQNVSVTSLFFIASGKVDIIVDSVTIADCGPGSLIGEIGISTGELATATAVCASTVRYLEFTPDRLSRVLEGHTDLLAAVELAIQKSIREKLQFANSVVAHSPQ
ncbi:MAG: cyclic nucleotide-binding domain-containing protein [Bauldia sp.]